MEFILALQIGTAMPLLEGATEWLNHRVVSNDLLERPILFQFWAISCPICKMNMPRLKEFLELYQERRLYLISVHQPRSHEDTDIAKVKTVVEELGINGPCAIDNDHTLGDRFQTAGLWPSYFLFDSAGKLRSRAAGGVGLKTAENSLKRLIQLD